MKTDGKWMILCYGCSERAVAAVGRAVVAVGRAVAEVGRTEAAVGRAVAVVRLQQPSTHPNPRGGGIGVQSTNPALTQAHGCGG